MTSRILIIDRKSMQPVANIQTSATYSWKYNDLARCEFEISTSDDKFREAFFQYHNLVYIEHLPTQQADGSLNGVLPSWIGVITPPRDWRLGSAAINVTSGEYLLKKRPLPLISKTGTPYALFTEIINQINNLPRLDFPIQFGVVDEKSTDVLSDTFSGSALEHLQNIATMSGHNFKIRGAIKDGKLNVYCDWRKTVGFDTGRMFSSINSKVGETILSKQGDLSTYIRAFSDASTESTRLAMDVFDEEAFGLYGFAGENVSFSGVFDQDPLTSAAKRQVALSSRPVRIFDFSALDFEDTFSYLDIANVWDVRITSAGFKRDGTVGYEGKVFISAMEYSDSDNEVALSLEAME